ncbi:MAG TPA: hypothetical protein VFC63_00905 [Blastocatellia bacterium]|nr:hypothetical protein [Blastocatellia bacterium]
MPRDKSSRKSKRATLFGLRYNALSYLAGNDAPLIGNGRHCPPPQMVNWQEGSMPHQPSDFLMRN